MTENPERAPIGTESTGAGATGVGSTAWAASTAGGGGRAVRPSLSAHARIGRRVADFQWLLDHLHTTYGPVVEVGFGRPPRKLTYVFGPDANRYVLADGAHNFRWSEAFDLTKFLIGETALLVSDGDDHARRRRLVQPAFAKRRLDSKLDIALDEFDKTLATWVPGSSHDAYEQMRQTVRRISIRAIFGAGIGDRADEIGDALAPALAYLTRSPAGRFDVDLRWNGYGRAVRSRRAADAIILAEVAGRRDEQQAGHEGYDILSAIAFGEDGEQTMSDTELCDQVRGLVAASYDTTASGAAWLIQLLGTSGQHLNALRTQVRDVVGDRAPTVDDLRSLPLVDAAVKETLRLIPPAPVGLRYSTVDVDICGVTIPAESLVVYSPYVSHRMSEHWDQPDRFDPTRWVEGEPVPFSYVPFGGGSRMCIGFALATLELQALAVRLAQSPGWSPANPNPTSRSVANFAPKGGIPITIG